MDRLDLRFEYCDFAPRAENSLQIVVYKDTSSMPSDLSKNCDCGEGWEKKSENIWEFENLNFEFWKNVEKIK